jgi:hypothetical protein
MVGLFAGLGSRLLGRYSKKVGVLGESVCSIAEARSAAPWQLKAAHCLLTCLPISESIAAARTWSHIYSQDSMSISTDLST